VDQELGVGGDRAPLPRPHYTHGNKQKKRTFYGKSENKKEKKD
jgi:hypothetical protein